MWISCGSCLLVVVGALVQMAILAAENRKRDKKYGKDRETVHLDRPTEFRNDEQFRYMLRTDRDWVLEVNTFHGASVGEPSGPLVGGEVSLEPPRSIVTIFSYAKSGFVLDGEQRLVNPILV